MIKVILAATTAAIVCSSVQPAAASSATEVVVTCDEFGVPGDNVLVTGFKYKLRRNDSFEFD
jgi:hypothetical protein